MENIVRTTNIKYQGIRQLLKLSYESNQQSKKSTKKCKES